MQGQHHQIVNVFPPLDMVHSLTMFMSFKMLWQLLSLHFDLQRSSKPNLEVITSLFSIVNY